MQQHGCVAVPRQGRRAQHVRHQGRGAQVSSLGQPAESGTRSAAQWHCCAALRRTCGDPLCCRLSTSHRVAASHTTCRVCACVCVFFLLQFYESPVAAALADAANISLPPSLYLKQSGMLDQMRREILCDGAPLVQADSTSASVRGNAMITASVNLMTKLYGQVDSSTSSAHRHVQDCERGPFLSISQLAAHFRSVRSSLPVSAPFLSLFVFVPVDAGRAGAGSHCGGRNRLRK